MLVFSVPESDPPRVEAPQRQITPDGFEVVVVRIIERSVDLAVGGQVADAVHQNETAVGTLPGQISVRRKIHQQRLGIIEIPFAFGFGYWDGA